MTTIINANTSAGLTQTADTSGIVKLQSNGVTTNALAWVNFNGTNGSIRSAYNVSGVTRNGAGDYTITFTTALSDTNYVVVGANVGSLQSAGGIFSSIVGNVASGTDVPLSTGSFRCNQRNYGGSYTDTTVVALAVFGN